MVSVSFAVAAGRSENKSTQKCRVIFTLFLIVARQSSHLNFSRATTDKTSKRHFACSKPVSRQHRSILDPIQLSSVIGEQDDEALQCQRARMTGENDADDNDDEISIQIHQALLQQQQHEPPPPPPLTMMDDVEPCEISWRGVRYVQCATMVYGK